MDDQQVSLPDDEALPHCPADAVTEDDLRGNIRAAVQCLEAWLRDRGRVEEAAEAEIRCAQVWHWRHHGVTMDTGRGLGSMLLRQIVAEETAPLTGGRFAAARELFLEICLAHRLEPFFGTAAAAQ